MKLWAKLLLFFRGSVSRQLTRVMDGENDNKQFCYLGANMVYVPSSILYQLILTDGWTNYKTQNLLYFVSTATWCGLMYYGCTVQYINDSTTWVEGFANVLSTSQINRIGIPDATTTGMDCCPNTQINRRLWNSVIENKRCRYWRFSLSWVR